MAGITTGKVDGTHFGYPESFGEATVTYDKHGEPIAIVFANKHTELRHYRRSGEIVIARFDEDGKLEITVD